MLFIEDEAEVRKKALPCGQAQYIRVFDVKSDVKCVLLSFIERETEVQKQALPCSPPQYIRYFEAFSKHEKHPLCVL